MNGENYCQSHNNATRFRYCIGYQPRYDGYTQFAAYLQLDESPGLRWNALYCTCVQGTLTKKFSTDDGSQSIAHIAMERLFMN